MIKKLRDILEAAGPRGPRQRAIDAAKRAANKKAREEMESKHKDEMAWHKRKEKSLKESKPTGAGYVDMPNDYYKPHEPSNKQPLPAKKPKVLKSLANKHKGTQ